MTKNSPLYPQLLQDQHNSLYGFLLTSSTALSQHHEITSDVEKYVKNFFQACSQNPFFIRMNNPSSLGAADEKTHLVIKVTQDFLYGLNEINCQSCACDTLQQSQKITMLHLMIQKYAQRIMSFCDLAQFEKTLSTEFKDYFLEALSELMNGAKRATIYHRQAFIASCECRPDNPYTSSYFY